MYRPHRAPYFTILQPIALYVVPASHTLAYSSTARFRRIAHDIKINSLPTVPGYAT